MARQKGQDFCATVPESRHGLEASRCGARPSSSIHRIIEPALAGNGYTFNLCSARAHVRRPARSRSRGVTGTAASWVLGERVAIGLEPSQARFLHATFAVTCTLSKADGVVSLGEFKAVQHSFGLLRP